MPRSPEAIASGRDPRGAPVHKGWVAMGGRRRWMEPFVLSLLAEGSAHGYALVGQLGEMGVFADTVDVGAVYRTLRDLEKAGQVSSRWSSEPAGARRRDYELTKAGYVALDEWAAVMRERARLTAEFDARYLAAVAVRRAPPARRPSGDKAQAATTAARRSRSGARGRGRPSSAAPSRPRARR